MEEAHCSASDPLRGRAGVRKTRGIRNLKGRELVKYMGSKVKRHQCWLSLRNRYPMRDYLRGLRRDGTSLALRGGAASKSSEKGRLWAQEEDKKHGDEGPGAEKKETEIKQWKASESSPLSPPPSFLLLPEQGLGHAKHSITGLRLQPLGLIFTCLYETRSHHYVAKASLKLPASASLALRLCVSLHPASWDYILKQF